MDVLVVVGVAVVLEKIDFPYTERRAPWASFLLPSVSNEVD
jgi:hypothetical protein